MLHDIMTPFSLLQKRGSNLRPLPEGGLGDSGTTSMILWQYELRKGYGKCKFTSARSFMYIKYASTLFCCQVKNLFPHQGIYIKIPPLG